MLTEFSASNTFRGIQTSMVFPLFGTNSNIYVANIDGLSPVKASINTFEKAVYDGAEFLSARSSFRNIVITFGILTTRPSEVEEAISKLNSLFVVKGPVDLSFKKSNKDYRITGYVESVDIDRFVTEPAVQVSIICPSIDFIGDLKQESFTYSQTKEINYQGTSPSGLSGGIYQRDGIAKEFSRFSIGLYINTDGPSGYYEELSASFPFTITSSKYDLKFNTEIGNKGIWYNGESVLSKLTPGYSFFQLIPGKNLLVTDPAVATPNTIVEIQYLERFNTL